jgi:hypothetical protein
MANFLNLKEARLKVSSVLDRNVKEYGKNFLTDGREDTCWNSDQGSPQFIIIDFEKEVSINQIQLMFLGEAQFSLISYFLLGSTFSEKSN